MDKLNKLLQDMKQELNRSSNTDTHMADGIEPAAYNSNMGNCDETLLSADTDAKCSLAELNQKFYTGDSDGILLSADEKENSKTIQPVQTTETQDSNEILLSENVQKENKVPSSSRGDICTICQNP
jgi:hypothetical protein